MSEAPVYGGATDVGRRREHNEDAILTTPPLFAVADGVGGAAKGEVASSTALEVFEQAGPSVHDAADSDAARAAMVEAVLRCNNSVHAAQAEEPDRAGMATTLTAAVVRGGGEVVVGHVGDSRGYLIDAGGQVRQVTDDHSLVGELVRAGQMSAEEAAVHPHRNVITRALGTESDVQVDAFVATLEPGDWLLLCSDGLTGHVSDGELGQAVHGMDSPDAAIRGLIGLANERGGTDNISVVLVQPLPPGAGGAAAPEAAGATATLEQRDVETTGELRLRPIDATDGHAEDLRTERMTTQAPSWQGGPQGSVETTQAITAIPATPPARNPTDPRGAPHHQRAVPPPVQPQSVRARYVRRVLVALFILLVAFVAGAVAWRQSYFVTEQAGGVVGIDQGFPVLGLHRVYRSSDVHSEDLEPADRERYVEGHTLRSREDAERIFDQLPELAGRCDSDTQPDGAGNADDTTLRDPNC